MDNSPLRYELPTYPQPLRLLHPWPKGDISTWEKRGHFYLGLTDLGYFLLFRVAQHEPGYADPLEEVILGQGVAVGTAICMGAWMVGKAVLVNP